MKKKLAISTKILWHNLSDLTLVFYCKIILPYWC